MAGLLEALCEAAEEVIRLASVGVKSPLGGSQNTDEKVQK